MAMVLVLIGIAGVIINGGMFAYTLRRYSRYDPHIDYSDVRSVIKAKIGSVTIRRALRLELVFLICQTVRLLHSLWVLYWVHREPQFPTVLERSLVTLLLIYLSLADLNTRRKMVPLLNELHPKPTLPDGNGK